MKELFGKYRFWLNCWGIVFAILCVVFSFYMLTFYVGNHDWQFVRYNVKFTNGFWEGRLTQFLLPVVLFDGLVLPILGAIIGIFSFAGAGVLLAQWYQLPQKYFPVIVFSLLMVLNPYVYTQLYYVHTVVSVLSWHLFSVVGMICVWKFAENFKLKWLFAAFICLWSAIAGYAPSLELILTIGIGKFLLDVLGHDKIDKALVKKYVIFAVILCAVMLAYVGSVRLLKEAKLLDAKMYNVQTLALADTFALLINQWDEVFKTFFMPVPFVSTKVNYLFIFLIGLFLYSAYQRKRLILCFIGLLGLFYGAFVLVYLSPYGIFKTMRIHSFSVPYIIFVISVASYLYGHNFKKNMTLLSVLVVVFMYLKADFMVEKNWYLGTEQDERLADRVRAEIMPKLVKGKYYRLSSVGSFYGRQKFAGFKELSGDKREIYREYYGYGLYLYRFFSAGLFMYEETNPIWGDATYFGNYLTYFILPEIVLSKDTVRANMFAQHFGADRDNLIAAADRLCAYPCQNFYYIGEKDILLMVSDDEISRLVLKWNIENERQF